MGARLFAIALDLFPTTFIAGSGHSPALLHGQRLLGLLGIEVLIGVGGDVGQVGRGVGVILGIEKCVGGGRGVVLGRILSGRGVKRTGRSVRHGAGTHKDGAKANSADGAASCKGAERGRKNVSERGQKKQKARRDYGDQQGDQGPRGDPKLSHLHEGGIDASHRLMEGTAADRGWRGGEAAITTEMRFFARWDFRWDPISDETMRKYQKEKLGSLSRVFGPRLIIIIVVGELASQAWN